MAATRAPKTEGTNSHDAPMKLRGCASCADCNRYWPGTGGQCRGAAVRSADPRFHNSCHGLGSTESRRRLCIRSSASHRSDHHFGIPSGGSVDDSYHWPELYSGRHRTACGERQRWWAVPRESRRHQTQRHRRRTLPNIARLCTGARIIRVPGRPDSRGQYSMRGPDRDNGDRRAVRE